MSEKLVKYELSRVLLIKQTLCRPTTAAPDSAAVVIAL